MQPLLGIYSVHTSSRFKDPALQHYYVGQFGRNTLVSEPWKVNKFLFLRICYRAITSFIHGVKRFESSIVFI